MAAAPPRRTPTKILVTGAAGFVGGHLMPALRTLFPDAAIEPSSFDVTDADAVRSAVHAMQPDACIHLAAISAIPAAQADPDLAWRVNLGGTLNLARALAGVPGCTLLFASTADAYGQSFKRGVALDESAALNPMNTYGATKAAADLALGAMARDGLHVIRARPFNHTGPGQSASFVVAAFARQVARIAAGLQTPELQVGALDPFRDFLDVRDVCRAYALCLQQRDALASGSILNIASGTPRRVGDVLSELLAVAGVSAEIRTDPARMRPSEIATAAGDATQARAVLGWAPAIPWAQTLADMLADWRERVGSEPS
jgi:GDP-4-dehydro-6-deoxy-D-mannose reductase